MTVVSIVEGDSEVQELPVLLRRLAALLPGSPYIDIARPIRVKRDQFLNRDEEFRRTLLLARAKAGPDGAILVLLDADDDCPAELGARLRTRIDQELGQVSHAVVLANREYEAWFLAAAPSLEGHRGFRCTPGERVQPEVTRNAKGWVGQHLASGTYREVLDQPALTQAMDLDLARAHSRSFRKLWDDWHRLTAGAS